MEKRISRNISLKRLSIEEEKKLARNPVPRKEVKKKAPVVDTRKVSGTSLDAPNALVVDKPKTSRDKELINTALNKHFIFTSLADENRGIIIEHMKHYTLGPGELVFEQDQPGNTFFIIASGKVDVLISRKKVKVLGPGDSFGELALLHDSPRSATIQTTERTTLWGLDRKTFRHAVETVNAQNYQENKRFIESVPLFHILTAVQRDALVGSLSTLKFRAGEKIVSEGDPGDLFYVVKEGIVSCTQGGREIRQMYRGDFFGEQALLYNCVRTASVSAVDDVKCVAIGRERLTKALGNHLQDIIYQNTKRMAIDMSETLRQLNKEQCDRLINALKIVTYAKNQIVVGANTHKGFHLWMVMKGKLVSRIENRKTEVFHCVGDVEITQPPQGAYSEDIIADCETIIAECTREEFELCIGGFFEQVTSNNEAHSILKRVELLRGMPPDRFQALILALQIKEFTDQEVIVQQNNPGDCFYIIKSGKVDVFKDGHNVRTITKHDYFGERSVLFNQFRSATVIANGEVTCWVLRQRDFLSIIDENIRTHLEKRIELQDDHITLDDLVIVKLLGKGMFGNVFLAAHRSKKCLYALKTVNRQKIERFEIQENLVLERKILLQLDHTLILKLIATFKDSARIYFLTEFVRGMDLFDVLRQLNLVTDKDAKFYTACLIIILEYLHERDIIYRDLKPENVMVDEDGYPKLIDFGTAKIVHGRTYTIVGTPHYMAPEVIVGKGYSVAVDYWSIGIMLYEFMCGGVPFGEEEEDPFAIYEKVLERRLIYPSFVDLRMPSKPIIEQLLSKNPAMRTGGSIENLKNHAWFNGYNWDHLISRQIEPPYKPRLHDLNREIQAASKNARSLTEIIAIEEANDELQPSKHKKSRSIDPNWDIEF